MNLTTRTNQALHISQLIPKAFIPFNVPNGENLFPPADEMIQSATSQNLLFPFEGGDPVRSTERVPESSSNLLGRERSASSDASVCSGTTDQAFQVEAA